MQDLEIGPFLAFILVTTFTPGPNNISSALMGLNFSYGKTLPYLFGIISGAASITFTCGLLSGSILEAIPSLDRGLRWFGAAYILWLAWMTLKTSWKLDRADSPPKLPGFKEGVFLQLLNPKLFVFAVSLFATFLRPIAEKPFHLFLAVLLLTGVNFASITLWNLCGACLSRHVSNPGIRKSFNTLLSLLLAYTALTLLVK